MSNNKYSFQITFDPFQNDGIYYYKIGIAVVLYITFGTKIICKNTQPGTVYINFTPVSRWWLSTLSVVKVVYYH